MVLNSIVGVSIGAAVGAAAVYGYMSERKVAKPAVSHSAASDASVKALKYGAPIRERMRFFTGYVASYDSATRNPLWVMEHLTRETAYGDAKRAENFAEDEVSLLLFCSVTLLSPQSSRMEGLHTAPMLQLLSNNERTSFGADSHLTCCRPSHL